MEASLIDDSSLTQPEKHKFNVMTPDNSYNPVYNGGGPGGFGVQMFPGLNTNPGGDFFVLPECVVVQGFQQEPRVPANPAWQGLYAVQIGGVLVDPVTGPAFFNGRGQPAGWNEISPNIPLPADPPIILPPFRTFTIQGHVTWFGPHPGESLDWNLWISERDNAG